MERKLLQIGFALAELVLGAAQLLWLWQRHVAQIARRAAVI